MPTVLDWNPTVDPSELLGTVREALTAGTPVLMPGDCGYVVLVNPVSPRAAGHLAVVGTPPAVLAWSADDPVGLGLSVSVAARRLMFRAWPAPLTIAVAGDPDWPAGWPPVVRKQLSAAGWLRFRCPEHPLFDGLIPALELPMLIVDTFQPTAEAALDMMNDSDALAVSVGELPVGEQPTVVTAHADRWEVSTPGVFAVEELEKYAARIVLFVCTGNTCRSPLAEGLAKKLLADRLGCGVDALPRRGLWVLSAGVAAYGGGPASPESVAVAVEFGADIADHQSRPVNPQLLAAADDVIAMTRGHAEALRSRFPGVGPVPKLLCGTADLDDPIGAGLEVYRDCARTIFAHLERLLPEWVGQ